MKLVVITCVHPSDQYYDKDIVGKKGFWVKSDKSSERLHRCVSYPGYFGGLFHFIDPITDEYVLGDRFLYAVQFEVVEEYIKITREEVISKINEKLKGIETLTKEINKLVEVLNELEY